VFRFLLWAILAALKPKALLVAENLCVAPRANGIPTRTAAAGRRFSAVSSALGLKAAEIAQTECGPPTIVIAERPSFGDCPQQSPRTATAILRLTPSPPRKLPEFTNFATRYCARERPTIPTTRLYCPSATNNPLKKQCAPPRPGAPSASLLSRTGL
jgi:hypothetical protein